MATSTWLGDHKRRPSTPLYQLYVDFMALYKCNYITLHHNRGIASHPLWLAAAAAADAVHNESCCSRMIQLSTYRQYRQTRLSGCLSVCLSVCTIVSLLVAVRWFIINFYYRSTHLQLSTQRAIYNCSLWTRVPVRVRQMASFTYQLCHRSTERWTATVLICESVSNASHVTMQEIE